MKKNINAFTIIELLVVVAIVGVLATIGIVTFSSVQSGVRNTQRSSRMIVVSEALEKYYDKNGEYPNCDALTAATASAIASSTLKGIDPDVLATPSAAKGANSFTSCSTSPTSDTFAYIGGGNSYTLQYKEEGGSVISLASRRQTAASSYILVINAGTGGTVNSGGTYMPGSTQTITATANPYYSFSSWSGTGCSGGASSTVTMNSNIICTANFTANTVTTPSTPTVTANTANTVTTWSWGASTCITGSMAEYQYDYTISPSGYDSTWTGPQAGTSVFFTTSQTAQTYTVAIQARCYNATTNTYSSWSASGSAAYYRPNVTTYTLTTTAGSGGTVSAGGTYNSGDTPTITATASANYTFSSWTGDTGCSGVASHTITMDANKSCTANFSIITYSLTLAAGGGGSVSGGGTYNSGSAPTMTASANTYYTFSSWSGSAGCSGVSSHTITMDAVKSCTANFTYTPPSFTLSLSAGTGGSVGGAGTYTLGSTPTITAYPSTDYTFSSWSGSAGCSGVSSHTITMDAIKSCTASFTYAPILPIPPTPTISVTQLDSTHTEFSWPSYNCGTGASNRWEALYTISPTGYSSGWYTQAASWPEVTVVWNSFITSTRYQTYTLQVKAMCWKNEVWGAWSGIGTASYYRP